MFNRRTAIKVKNGRVQPKDRHRPTAHEGYVLDRESPGRGFRHVVTKRDVQTFIELIPAWDRYSRRLERIVLARYDDGCDGLHKFYHREETGAIFLHAWREDLWTHLSLPYFDDHRDIFQRLGVSHDRLKSSVACRFTEAQARAYVLLHVFLHELGHHYDIIQQKHLGSSKGEDYAEQFALRHFDQLLPDYVREFGDPARGR
jgi:hypothetical protein